MFDKVNKLINDPLDELIDDEKESSENINMGGPDRRDRPYVLNNEDEWPYNVDFEDSETVAQKPIKMFSSDGEVYAGEYVRDAMEMHRYKPKSYTWFGYTRDAKKGVEHVGIPFESLFKHAAIFGTTGYGKSTVLKNLMFQWITSGYGVCFIDPLGDDSEDLLRMIPEHRKEDVIWVEPGVVEREKTIGFNFFDTYSEPGSPMHEKEVSEIESDFVDILDASASGWGATIESVAHAVSKQLIKAEEPYNLVDMYKILRDDEELEKFVDVYGDDIEKMFLRRLKDKDDEELDPLNRRLRKFAEKPITREVLAHTESSISITEAIEEGKILLVNTSSIPDEEVAQLVSSSLVNRIWSTIRARSDMDPQERTPYFLCIDEFNNVVSDNEEAGMDMPDILSRARSLRLSVTLANQQPNQLPRNVREGVYSNCENLFTFNPGAANYKDANSLSKGIGDIDVDQILGLSPYKLLGRVTINDEKTDPLYIHTFPPYPPRRSEEEAEKLKEDSIERYGVERTDDTDDIDRFGVLRFFEDEKSEKEVEINDEGETIVPQQVLECVYTSQIKYETHEFDGLDDWIHEDDLREEIGKYVGKMEYAVLDNILEKIPEQHLDRKVAGDVYFRLTPKGETKAFEQDTGKSASAGKAAHRELLREGHKVFTKLGYDVTRPKQHLGRQPDGVAKPPIDPMAQSNDFEEAKKLRSELKDILHENAWELFGDKEISLEAESTTIGRPKQTIKNLTKAVEKGRECVFLVKDGTQKKGEFEYWARAGTNILKGKDGRAEFVAEMDMDGNRTFYNTQEKIELKDGSRALQKKEHGRTKWVEENEKETLCLKSNKGETLLRVSSDENLENLTRREVPYHYFRDTDNKVTVVKDSDGNLVGEYENLSEIREAGFRPIYKPLFPEEIFPAGEYPDQDTWTFIIIPTDSSREPQVYEDGELTPLFSGDFSGEKTVENDINTNDTNNTEYDDSENDDDSSNIDKNDTLEMETQEDSTKSKDNDEVVSIEDLGFTEEKEPEEVAQKVDDSSPDNTSDDSGDKGPTHLSEVDTGDEKQSSLYDIASKELEPQTSEQDDSEENIDETESDEKKTEESEENDDPYSYTSI